MPKRKRSEAARKGWKRRKPLADISNDNPKKKRKMWSNESMINAMEAVRSGMGVNRAALEYGVPKATLKDRIAGRVVHGIKPGPEPYLTAEEEDELATFLIEVCKMGHGKTKQEVLLIVQKTLKKKRRLTEHFNGEGWWTRFTKRHPEITLRTPDPLSYSRSNAVNQETLDHYFALLCQTLTDNNLLDKPSLIYNMDESGMPLDHKQLKRIGQKGMKKVHGRASGNKSQITILACANAAGTSLPPMVIFKGERFNHDWTRGEVPDTLYGMSPQGWIDQELFALWLHKHFISNIPPARLLLDGHSSHYTPEGVKLAAEEGIIMFCLPPHTTHVAQPLDVSFFGPLKKNWSKVCQFMSENPGKVVTKFNFSSLFAKAWYLTIRPDLIVSGFRKVGVCPFDSSAIKPYTSTLEASKSTTMKDQLSPSSPKETADIPECKSSKQFTQQQILLYECRYENGYDLYDPDYFEWLRQVHPDSSKVPITSPGVSQTSTSDDNTVTSEETTKTSSSEKLDSISDPNLSMSDPVEGPSQGTPSLPKCKSSSQPKKLLSCLSEFLHHPESNSNACKKKGTTSTARVLTSEDSLSMLMMKEKQKRELEEAKEKRKKEREEKKKAKEEENKRKAEEKVRKAEEKRKEQEKKQKLKRTKKNTLRQQDDSLSDSTEDGVQGNEILSDECAICFGLYEDDLSTTGKLEKDWVQCTNHTCQKWMHAECLEQDEDDLFLCTHCSTFFA